MPLIAAYHRPRAIDDALSLLADRRRRPIGGGTTITADREPSDLEVVDLQALGLDGIQRAEDTVLLGATATLAAVATHADVPEAVAWAELAVSRNPRSAIAYRVQGDVWRQAGHLDRAAQAYRDGLSRAPQDRWLRQRLEQYFTDSQVFFHLRRQVNDRSQTGQIFAGK